MYDYNRYFDVEDMFSSLFVIAGQTHIKEDCFTRGLENHPFILDIEKGDYLKAYNYSVKEIFDEVSGVPIIEDYRNVINNYYWVGKCYFYINDKTHKAFSYIFLKLPFKKLLDMYNPYHETDLGNVLDIFLEKEKEITILEALVKRRKISLTLLSKEVDIAISTLRKYKNNDEYLYKASFVNIYKLASYFNVPETLFLKEVFQKK